MNNWAYDEPADESSKFNRHVVYTERQIINEHLADFMKDSDYMFEAYDPSDINNLVIDDWILGNWAYRTNEEPGETITLRD